MIERATPVDATPNTTGIAVRNGQTWVSSLTRGVAALAPAGATIQNVASRGPIAVAGSQDALSLTTPLTGTLNVTGSLSSKSPEVSCAVFFEAISKT